MTASPAPVRRDGTVPLIVGHTVAAPRERVWRAWTDRDELMRWFGPCGFTMPVASMDLRPGGRFHHCLRGPDGAEVWSLWIFETIEPPRRLVLEQSFADAQGRVVAHPMVPTWPRRTRSTLTFDEGDGGTAITLRKLVIDGTEEEHRTYEAALDGMRQGWAGTFAQLDRHLGV